MRAEQEALVAKYNIWEGDPPNIYSMRSLRKTDQEEPGMHIVKTFEVDTDEEARTVFDDYSKAMREADG